MCSFMIIFKFYTVKAIWVLHYRIIRGALSSSSSDNRASTILAFFKDLLCFALVFCMPLILCEIIFVVDLNTWNSLLTIKKYRNNIEQLLRCCLCHYFSFRTHLWTITDSLPKLLRWLEGKREWEFSCFYLVNRVNRNVFQQNYGYFTVSVSYTHLTLPTIYSV